MAEKGVEEQVLAMERLPDIEKIDELQENIVKDMLELVGAKEQIMEVIGKVENKEMLALLELRFLCYESGEEIADLLGYSVDNVF